MNNLAHFDFPQKQSTDNQIIEDKRIRVEEATGGFSMIPHRTLARSFRELKGAEISVFLYVWEQTVAYRQYMRSIPIADFVTAVEAYSERSIWEAIRSLQSKGWLTTKDNGNQAQLYGVALTILEEAGCMVSDKAFDRSGKVCQTSYNKDLRSKRKKKNTHRPHTPTTVSVGREEVGADAGGIGFRVPSKIPARRRSKPPNVERLSDKYPDEPIKRIEAFCRKLESIGVYDVESCFVWDLNTTLDIIKNFEYDCSRGHNMNDPAACLHYRIRNCIWDAECFEEMAVA